MTHPKVAMWLETRDRAYARGDVGIIRSMNSELRRLAIPDTATLANPTGKRVKVRREPERAPEETAVAIAETPVLAKTGGRPRLPRCEHENIADRCEICNPELAAH